MAASQASQPNAPLMPELRLSPPASVLTRAPINALMRNFVARYRSRGFVMGWQPSHNTTGMVQPVLRRYLPLESMLGVVNRIYRLRRRRDVTGEAEDSGWDEPEDDYYQPQPSIQAVPPIVARARLFAPPIVQSWQADNETALARESRIAYSQVPRTLPNQAGRAAQAEASPNLTTAPANLPPLPVGTRAAKPNSPIARQAQNATSAAPAAQPTQAVDSSTLVEKVRRRASNPASSPVAPTGSAQIDRPAITLGKLPNPTVQPTRPADNFGSPIQAATRPVERGTSARIGSKSVSSADSASQIGQSVEGFEPLAENIAPTSPSLRLRPPTPLMHALGRQEPGDGPDLMRQWTGANPALNLPRLTMTIPPIIARTASPTNPAIAARAIEQSQTATIYQETVSPSQSVTSTVPSSLPLTHPAKTSDKAQPIQKGQTTATDFNAPEFSSRPPTDKPTTTPQADGVGTRRAVSSPSATPLPTQETFLANRAPALQRALTRTEPTTAHTPGFVIGAWLNPTENIDQPPLTMHLPNSRPAATIPTNSPETNTPLLSAKPGRSQNNDGTIADAKTPSQNKAGNLSEVKAVGPGEVGRATNDTKAVKQNLAGNILNTGYQTEATALTASTSGPFSSALARVYQRLVAGEKIGLGNPAPTINNAQAIGEGVAATSSDVNEGQSANPLARAVQRSEFVKAGNLPTASASVPPARLIYADNYTEPVLMQPKANPATKPATKSASLAVAAEAGPSVPETMAVRNFLPDNKDGAGLVADRLDSRLSATERAVQRIGQTISLTDQPSNLVAGQTPLAFAPARPTQQPEATGQSHGLPTETNLLAPSHLTHNTPPASAISSLPIARSTKHLIETSSPADTVPPLELVHPTKSASPTASKAQPENTTQSERMQVSKQAELPKANTPNQLTSAISSGIAAQPNAANPVSPVPMSNIKPTPTAQTINRLAALQAEAERIAQDNLNSGQPINRLAAMPSAEAPIEDGQAATAYPPVPMSQPVNVSPHFEPGDFAVAAEAPARPGQLPKVPASARRSHANDKGRALRTAKADDKHGPTVQRKATAAPANSPAEWSPPTEILRTAVGQPLERQVRENMSQVFGTRFDHVRVHTNPEAAASAAHIDAEAYTVGPNIFFGAGRYQPHRPEGQALIGHELTHVVQQASLPSLGSGRMPETSAQGQQLERQAIQNERLILQHLSQPKSEIAPASNIISREVVTRTGQAAPPLNLPTMPAPSHLRPTSPAASNPAIIQREVNAIARVNEDESSNSATPALDYDLIAQKVFRLLKQQLQNDRERTGLRGGFFH